MFDRRLWCTLIETSAQIATGCTRKLSSVSWMPPSVEFSMGTMPRSIWRRVTSSNTAGMSESASYSTEEPNFFFAARWLYEPLGPRYPMRRGRSSAKEPDMSSRQMLSMVRSREWSIVIFFDLVEYFAFSFWGVYG